MQDGQFANTPFEDLLNAAGVHAPEAPAIDKYSGATNKVNPADLLQAFQNNINSKGNTLSPSTVTPISPSQIDTSGRFPKQRIGADNEDLYAQGQKWYEKAFNGIVKGAATAGTTFLQGTVGLLYGLSEWGKTGKFSSVYDNDLSQALNQFTQGYLENKLPNYYSAKERAADWYEPANLFTANFLFDKIIKNLGFSLGAVWSGSATFGALKALRAVIPIAGDAVAMEKLGNYLESTLGQVPKAERVGFAANAIRNTSKTINTLDKILPGQRALVSTLGAFTESGLESLQNSNQYRDALIQEYKDTNGFSPQGDDLASINDEASKVGKASFGLNMLLLTATNYIQLPKILGSSYSTNRAVLNNIERKAVGETIESALPKRGIGRLLLRAKNIGGLAFSPSEAFEEASQNAIQVGTQAYYDKKRKSEDTNVFDEAVDAYYDTFTTKQGMEQLLIGGFSGGLQQIKENLHERGLTGYGGERAKNTAKAVSDMQAAGFGQAIKSGVDNTRRSINIQTEKSIATEAGDKLTADELEFDDAHNYLTSRIKWGKYDFVKEDIEHYRQEASTDEGFEKLREKGIVGEGDTREDFIKRLGGFERHADNVNSLYKSLNTRYAGIYVKGKDGNPIRKYSDSTIEKMVYAASKVANYDQSMPELSSELLSTYTKDGEHIDVQSVIDDASKGWEKATLEPYEKARTQIMSMETINKDELLQALDDVVEKSMRRKQLYDEYEDIKSNPQNHEESTDNEATVVGAPVETQIHKIKTKDGEQELKEGVEYEAISFDKRSKKEGAKVFEFGTFKILGKNEDGTYAIESSNGYRKNVSPDFLSNFKITTAESLKGNKKYEFFKAHANQVAFYNFGVKAAAKILGVSEESLKGNGRVKGRIFYDHEKDVVRFFYVNKNGKSQSVVIKAEDFSPKYAKQKGFKWTKLSFNNKEMSAMTAEELAAQEKETGNIGSGLSEWDNRIQIIKELVNETSSRIDNVNKQLSDKKEELKSVQEELSDIESRIEKSSPTRKGNFKKTTKAALRGAQRLSRLRDTLKEEIDNLENDKLQLEQHLEYYFDLYEHIGELPEDRTEFMEQIKSVRDDIGDAIANTGIAIVDTNKLLSKVEKALKSAIDLGLSLVAKFEAKFPGMPTNYRDAYARLESLANGTLFQENREALQPGIFDDLKALQEEIANLEDLDIVPGERSVNELKTAIQALYEDINSLQKQQDIVSAIYDRFDNAFKAQEEQERQKAELLKNRDALKHIYGDSGDVGSGNPTDNGKKDAENDQFNAAKPVANVASTTDPSGEHGYAPKQDFHKRHEVFLNAYTFLPDERRKNIRVVIVNANIEDELGLMGLTDKVLGAASEEVKSNKMDPVLGVLTAVYTEQDGDTYHLLNEKGERIGILGEKGKEAELLNTAVYSTMSAAKTIDSRGKGRFIENQSGESAHVISMVEWWKGLRTKLLGSKSAANNTYQIDVSSGIPRRVEGGTKVSPIGTVIEANDLNTPGIIQVSVNGVLSVNGFSKKYPIGSPVLIKNNSALILNNRNVTKTEAENVYKALLNLASTPYGEKWNVSVRNWLGNILFFSDPNSGTQKKEPGRNQIWVDFNDGNLHIGKKEFVIPFTQADIMQNESLIKSVVQGAYINVNNSTLRKGLPFEEIIGWKNDVPQTRVWKSYQHYLLSPTYALDASLDETGENGKPREDEIPLSANIIKPQEGEMQGVFKQRYSTIIPKEDEVYVSPVVKKPQEKEIIVKGTPNNLQTLLDKVNSTEDITPIMDDIFKELDENEYEKFQATVTDAELKSAISDKLKNSKSQEESVNVISKYLLTRFIKSKMEAAAKEKTIEVRSTPTAGIVVGERTVDDIMAELDDTSDDFDENLAHRLINGYNVPRITEEEWKSFEEWMKKNLPNVPVKRVGSIIDMGKGNPGAWGMLHNGIIKIFELAEKGTEYHEAFEAVWRYYVTDRERSSLHEEFKKRKGTFVERGTGQTIEYKNATLQQAKEELADEFFDYKQSKKIPQAIPGQRRGVLGFFVELWNTIKNWVKSIFYGPTESLFNKINTGYYSNSTPIRDLRGKEFSAIRGTTEQLTREIMENISANVTFTLLGDKDSNAFYNFNTMPVNELYSKVKEFTLNEIIRNKKALKKLIENPETSEFDRGRATQILLNADNVQQLITNNWEEIKNKNKEFLRQVFRIKVSDEGVQVEDEQKNRNDYARDNFFIDTKKSAPTAVKLLFMTLVEAEKSGRTIGETGIPVVAKNSYGGSKLVKSSKAFIDVMKDLVNTNTLDGMLGKLYDLSKKNPDYVRLYSRLKGNINERGQLNWDKLSFDDLRLISSFYTTFAKQAPTPYIIFYRENGDVIFQRADLNSLINSTTEGWISNLRMLARGGNEYITKGKIGKLTSYTISIPKDKIVYTGDIKTVLKDKLLPLLSKLGVNITPNMVNNLSDTEASTLKKAAEDFLNHINVKGVTRINRDNVGVGGPLSTMAEVVINNSDIEDKMTYFNVENEQQQLYIDNNFISKLSNTFNDIGSLDELKKQFPEYNDVFSDNSLVLRKGGKFFNEDGSRTSAKLSLGYLNGILTPRGPRKIGKLSKSDRMLSFINAAINPRQGGWYPVITPADSSTEYLIQLGRFFEYADTNSNTFNRRVRTTFSGYLKDEINLAVDRKNRSENANIDSQKSNLRFFNGILRDSLKSKIDILIKSSPSRGEVSEFVSNYISEMEEDVMKFLSDKANRVRNTLESEGKIKLSENANEVIVKGVDSDFLREKENGFSVLKGEEAGESFARMSDKQLDNFLLFITANHAASVIELHKVVFGDPYQFAIKTDKAGRVVLDEAKRAKQSLSPRRSIVSGEKINSRLNQVMNSAGGVKLQPGDYGYTNFDDELRTNTIANFTVLGAPTLEGHTGYSEVDRSDSQMWMMPTMHREVLLKSGGWSQEAENLFQYDAASFRKWWSTQDKKWGKEYNKSAALVSHDEKIIKKGKPKGYASDILKPIITGPKSGREYIDYMTDKMSAFPMYFTNLPKDSHLIQLFIKNFKSGADYSIVPTGRKVGVENIYHMYSGAEVNNTDIPKNHIFTIPITNFGIQLETTSDGTTRVTRGTQATKEVSLDLMDNGQPTDYEGKDWENLTETEKETASLIYKEIKNNENILNALTNHGYDQLLDELSITDTGERYIISSPEAYKKLSDTLKDEVYRKDANDNVVESVEYNERTGKFNINFEASSNYQSIKNILLSIVDRNVVSQKMNGGSKIQLSSALFDTDNTIHPYIKRGKEWAQLTKEEYNSLSDKEKKNVKLFSTRLKFYSRDKNGTIQRAQVLLPHWFKNRIKGSKLLRNASDEEIMKMLSFTEEGRKILQGVGFRIPTQGHNFMDAFEVAGFLPQEMGDTIVLPAEITTKSGSDFDVDKLNVYLRNIYVDHRQEIKMVPFFGFGGEAIENVRKFIAENQIKELLAVSDEEIYDTTLEDAEDIGVENKDKEFFKKSEEKGKRLIPTLYRESLENAYIESFEKLLLHPRNFDRLIKPNDNNGMQELRDKLLDAIGKKEIEEARDISVLLSLNWMNSQRHNVITAKELIGVGALGITHQSLTQRTQVVLDPERIASTYVEDKKFLGDGSIALSHNTIKKGNKVLPTLSAIYDRAKQAISYKMSAYTNGFVDAVKDPFLAEMGVDRQTAGTFTFLERIGVPTPTVVYFMNQPIIREYLRNVYSSGSTYLYNDANIEDTLNIFGGRVGDSLNEKDLFSNIEDYYSGKKFDNARNAEQGFILKEFLKYSKMASHLREFQQATNWDTANFSDFTHSMIKSLVHENAKEKNIFGDPAQILDSSFLGNLKNKILRSNTALSSILKFQQPAIQSVLGNVLYPMINPRDNYLSDRDVVRLGNSVVSSFIDYITQTIHKENNTSLNSLISSLLVGENSVARDVQKIKNDRSNSLNTNYAFNRLSTLMATQDGEVDNITNKLTDKDPFSQNQFISALQEIKDINEPLYRKLVLASILQSGVKKSVISFTDLIPLSDYASIVNPIIETLVDRGEFQYFAQNNLFQRNNWGNKSIVPQLNMSLRKSKAGKWYMPYEVNSYRNAKAVESIEAITGKNSPMSLPITILMNSREGKSDIVAVRRNNIQGFTKEQIAEMQAKGDWGYKITMGYQKVRDAAGNPLIISEKGKDDNIYYKYVYKPINLWGDGIHLQEYYNDTRKSAVDNGTYKINHELDNSTIINAFKNDVTFGVPEGYTQASITPEEGTEGTC